MRKMIWLLIAIALGYIGYKAFSRQNSMDDLIRNEMKVLIVYNNQADDNNNILEAYKSVLQEEGVSFSMISNEALIALSPEEASLYVPAIIFPEFVNQTLVNSTEYWVGEYVKHGGKVALIHDVNTKDQSGKFKTSPTYLDRIVGIDFTEYHQESEKAYAYGLIRFLDKKSAGFFEFPPGKLDKNDTIVGYKYGILKYPMMMVRSISKKDQTCYAKTQDSYDVILQKQYGKGSLLYVNTPLGAIKGESDDIIIRSILKTFLFKIAYVPHLVSSPNAKGTLIINWHIDSSVEYTTLPWVFENNYIRKDMNQSFHITAGPDLYEFGDHLGFDAEGKGYPLVKEMMQYGTIGSHGGWIHNWFAENILEQKLDKAQMKAFIEKNNEVLEQITGYKPVEYSAPAGVFPPIESIEILEELGIKAFYYTGDAGSSPNRTFYNGRMLSKDIIAFPVMTFGDVASHKEFNEIGESEKNVEKNYIDLIDYIVDNRTVRLFYSHPYDIYKYQYRDAMRSFMDYIENKIDLNQLQTRTLSNMRDFLIKLIETDQEYQLNQNRLQVKYKNKLGLDELVVAMPKTMFDKSVKVDEKYEEDKNYYYIPLPAANKEATFFINFE